VIEERFATLGKTVEDIKNLLEDRSPFRDSSICILLRRATSIDAAAAKYPTGNKYPGIVTSAVNIPGFNFVITRPDGCGLTSRIVSGKCQRSSCWALGKSERLL
jgi:hypothetical protein